jgi:hypothetical protein
MGIFHKSKGTKWRVQLTVTSVFLEVKFVSRRSSYVAVWAGCHTRPRDPMAIDWIAISENGGQDGVFGPMPAAAPWRQHVNPRGAQATPPLICKKIFEIDRDIFKIGKIFKLTVNFNVKRPAVNLFFLTNISIAKKIERDEVGLGLVSGLGPKG